MNRKTNHKTNVSPPGQGGGAVLLPEPCFLPGRLPPQRDEAPSSVSVLPFSEGLGLHVGLQLHRHPSTRHAQLDELPA
eukprot:6919823-Pyramimonas_sp.AAC.1